MQGHIRRRGKGGSYEYIIDIGEAQAQRCAGCGRRFWVEHAELAACPRCGGTLRPSRERRRQTKAGFASRKEARAAMNKVLAAVAEHSYVAATRLTVEQFLEEQWLPAIESTVRLTTYRSYVQHVTLAHRASPGRGAAAVTLGVTDQRPLRDACRLGQARRQERPLSAHHPPRPCRLAPGLEGRGALGRTGPQPDRGGRPATASARAGR